MSLSDLRDFLFGPGVYDLEDVEEEDIPPDPLDDYSLLSNREVWIRYTIKGFLVIGFLYSAGMLISCIIGMMDVISSLFYIELFFLSIFLTSAFYLSLVHFDTGRWTPIHPLIPKAIDRFHKETLAAQAVVILDLILVGTIAFFIFSGWIYWKNGMNVFFLLVGLMIILNVMFIYGFSQVDSSDRGLI